MNTKVSLKEWLTRLMLVGVSTLAALLVLEVASRFLYPISDGRFNVTLDGEKIEEWFEPGSIYRQLSNEYDAVTTITDKAHRVPGTSGNPDVVFIGDSFTFGWGLADDESFASIYCESMQVSCANLGVPGTGTAKQVDRLELYLNEWNWKPRQVKLIFFGMSTSFSSGNDFVDNYDHGMWLRGQENNTPQPKKPSIGIGEKIIGLQSLLLGNSNLLRITKYLFGPALKSMLLADPGARMETAKELTKSALDRLERLSNKHGFDYQIYLLVPVQDIILETHTDTASVLQSISPQPVISTAHLFFDRPETHFYAYDGHINAKGAKLFAEFLVSLDKKSSP